MLVRPSNYHACKDLGLLPVDTIRIPVLARPEQNKADTTFMDMPIIPPHLLVVWLQGRGMLNFSPQKAQELWTHHRKQGAAFMLGRAGDQGSASWEPWALYDDKAEYTITKEKLLVLFCSPWHFSKNSCICSFFYVPTSTTRC